MKSKKLLVISKLVTRPPAAPSVLCAGSLHPPLIVTCLLETLSSPCYPVPSPNLHYKLETFCPPPLSSNLSLFISTDPYFPYLFHEIISFSMKKTVAYYSLLDIPIWPQNSYCLDFKLHLEFFPLFSPNYKGFSFLSFSFFLRIYWGEKKFHSLFPPCCSVGLSGCSTSPLQPLN